VASTSTNYLPITQYTTTNSKLLLQATLKPIAKVKGPNWKDRSVGQELEMQVTGMILTRETQTCCLGNKMTITDSQINDGR
jgi:hypothetical protein